MVKAPWPPFSPVRPHVGENVLREYLPAIPPPSSEMTSFCQKEFILDDFRNRVISGNAKIWGIGRKRYNNVFSGP